MGISPNQKGGIWGPEMIEYHEDLGRGAGVVRTVACPFCDAPIDGRGGDLPTHLRRDCEAIQ